MTDHAGKAALAAIEAGLDGRYATSINRDQLRSILAYVKALEGEPSSVRTFKPGDVLPGGMVVEMAGAVDEVQAGLKLAGDKAKAIAALEAENARLREAVERAGWAKQRLHEYSLSAQAGRIDACGRETERRVWAAFSDFDAACAELEAK